MFNNEYPTLGEALAGNFGGRGTIAELHDGSIDIRRFNPSSQVSPGLLGEALARAYANRWGFLPNEIKGSLREHSLPDRSEIQQAARHPANPFGLQDNRNYVVTDEDMTDLDLVTADGRQPLYWTDLDALVKEFGPQPGPFPEPAPSNPPSAPPAPAPPPATFSPLEVRIDELTAAARPWLRVIARLGSVFASVPTLTERAGDLEVGFREIARPAVILHRRLSALLAKQGV
jgi:hypothetical protein